MVPNIYNIQQLSIHSGEEKNNQKQNQTNKKIMTQMTTSRIPLNL